MFKNLTNFIKNIFKDYFDFCGDYYLCNSSNINDKYLKSIYLKYENLNYNALTCWLLDNSGNNSGKYLCKIFMNRTDRVAITPDDYDNYIECYNFLKIIPEKNIEEIIKTASTENTEWKNIFEHWDELERQLIKNTEKSKDRIEDILYECHEEAKSVDMNN